MDYIRLLSPCSISPEIIITMCTVLQTALRYEETNEDRVCDRFVFGTGDPTPLGQSIIYNTYF